MDQITCFNCPHLSECGMRWCDEERETEDEEDEANEPQ